MYFPNFYFNWFRSTASDRGKIEDTVCDVDCSTSLFVVHLFVLKLARVNHSWFDNKAHCSARNKKGKSFSNRLTKVYFGFWQDICC